jgi:hypothetical protein
LKTAGILHGLALFGTSSGWIFGCDTIHGHNHELTNRTLLTEAVSKPSPDQP